MCLVSWAQTKDQQRLGWTMADWSLKFDFLPILHTHPVLTNVQSKQMEQLHPAQSFPDSCYFDSFIPYF